MQNEVAVHSDGKVTIGLTITFIFSVLVPRCLIPDLLDPPLPLLFHVDFPQCSELSPESPHHVMNCYKLPRQMFVSTGDNNLFVVNGKAC